MGAPTVIRYTTHAEVADENARLVGDVFTELATTRPSGLHYTALRLDDGVSFVHIVSLDGDHNPLSTSPAFAAFQAGIGDRCAVGPVASGAAAVGTYEPLPVEA